MIHALLQGLTALGDPLAIALMLVGMMVGIFVGMLPGLGTILVLSLMLPFDYHLAAVPAIAMMLATQSGSYFSASITAILLNTPGAPESYPTTFDGYPIARRGEAGRALAISAMSTGLGALVGCVALVGLVEIAGPLSAAFHPPEYVAIIILALVLIGQLGGTTGSTLVLSAGVGFMLSFVGSDPITARERFTFGSAALFSGLGVVPFAVGIFAITQMIVMYGEKSATDTTSTVQKSAAFRRQVRVGVGDTLKHWFLVIRSAILGVVLGLVPGIGGFAANFISYGAARQFSRRGRERFGTGVVEGVIAPESSSIAKEVGSLLPAVALGLPSGLGMVVFLASLTILGLQPGPAFIKEHPSLPYTMMWVFAIVGPLSSALGLVIAPWLSRVTRVRGPILFPLVVAVSILGSFASTASMASVVELVLFGAAGLVFRKLGFSLAAMALAFVLGGVFDSNIYLTHEVFHWTFAWRSPLADAIIAVAIGVAFVSWRGRSAKGRSTGERRPPEEIAHPIMSLVTNLVFVAVCAGYVAIASGYPLGAMVAPMIVGVITLVVACGRTVGGLVRLRRAMTARARQAVDPPSVAVGAAVGAGDSAVLVAGQAPPGAAGDAGGGGRGAGAGPPVGQDYPSPVEEPRSPAAPAPTDGRAQIRELLALGWVVAFPVGAYLLGFRVGIPLVAAVYCLIGIEFETRLRRIAFAVGATVAVALAAYGFVGLFHLTYTAVIPL